MSRLDPMSTPTVGPFDTVLWAIGREPNVAGVPANATPASVINLSLGGPGRCGSLIQGAITTARTLGATVVAATGNGGGSVFYQSASDPGSFPANCSGVVSVAATSRTGRIGLDSTSVPYPNTGDKVGQVTLSAPGMHTEDRRVYAKAGTTMVNVTLKKQ